MPLSDVIGHRSFRGLCCPEGGGSMVLQTTGILPHHYTVSQPNHCENLKSHNFIECAFFEHNPEYLCCIEEYHCISIVTI